MIENILSYCSSNEVNDCVSDGLSILKRIDFTAHPYLSEAIQDIDQRNGNLSLAIGTVRSSKFASMLEDDDNVRDRLLLGLSQVTKACTLRKDKEIASNATEVYRIIKAHDKDLRYQGYQSESAGIDSLATELSSDKMKRIMDTLPECNAFLQEVIAANGQFKNDYDASMAHRAEIEKLDAPSIQKRLIRKLFNTKIIRFVNMMAEVDTATFTPIAKQLAPYIEKINTTAKARKSRKEQEPTAEPEAS